MREIVINNNEANQRSDKFLAKYLDKATKSFIYKMMRKKNITLNDKKMDGNEKLIKGDVIKIFFAEETLDKFSSSINGKADKNIYQGIAAIDSNRIVYEDDNLILYNKPAGMLSQKAEINDVSANEHLIKYMLDSQKITRGELNTFKPSVCNRLDRNTSGLLIFGKSMVGIQTMSRLLKAREVHKYYLCIVEGVLEEEKEITGYISKNNEKNMVRISDKNDGGDYIRTRYIPICNNGNYTLLKVLLITGKTHQIRAHLASINHAIIGDSKYGKNTTNELMRKKYGLKYQLLHSYELIFENVDGTLSYLSGRKFAAAPGEKFLQIVKGEHLDGNLE